MPRRDDDSAEFTRRSRRVPVAWWWVAGLVVACSVSGVVMTVAVARSAVRAETRPTVSDLGLQAGRGKKTTRKYPRDDLRAILVGKSKEGVLEVIGRPDATEDYGGGSNLWKYKGLAYDPISGKADETVFVYFGADGRVSLVSF